MYTEYVYIYIQVGVVSKFGGGPFQIFQFLQAHQRETGKGLHDLFKFLM